MKPRRTTWTAAALLGLVGVSLASGLGSASASPQPTAAPAASAAASAPLGSAAVSEARQHLRANAGKFALGAADVDGLVVSSVVPDEANGLTHVYFQQQVHSIDISNAMVNVAVRADGTVFRVASNAVGSATKLAGAADPKITDIAAANAAAQALGLTRTESFASTDAASGPSRARVLADGGISADPITVRLVYQPTAEGGLRLAWELVINQLDGEHWWQIRMDAADGAELGSNDWVAQDSHNVYPLPVEAPSFATPVNARTIVTNPATSASPFGWNDTNGAAGAESTLTIGNNVRAYTDVDANNTPDTGSSPDGGASLNFNFPLDLTQPPSAYRPAAVDEPVLHQQPDPRHPLPLRLHRGGGQLPGQQLRQRRSGRDAVNAEAQDGSGTNNANFGTPPDGSAPRMQMYIWTAPTPDRDGDLDNGIIIHEYGHGVSNRLTGGPATTSCLNNAEQAGEGWSDFLSYMLTMPSGVEPAGGRGIGTYALNQPTTGLGIRNQRYSTNTSINTSSYDTIKSSGGSEHNVGEVWAEMLWEVNYAMIAEHGFDADLINGTAGNNKTLQLVMDGLKLQPCSPGFVDARNAIIAADQADNAGANKCLLWTAFAKRGLGFSATQGSSGSVSDGTQAFDLPVACNGVAMTATATPSPVPAGQQLTYDVHLVNNAAGPVSGVTATSHIGDHATYVAGSATCSGTYNGGTETVTFPIGTMATAATRDCQLKVAIDPSPFGTAKLDDDFEPNLSNWVASHGVGAADWTLSTTDPHSPTHAAFATDPATTTDQYLRLAAPVSVTAGDTLVFWHTRGLEAGYDGGVVEVSTNGGGSWNDIGAAAFTANGYNGTINTGFSSPIAGRQAFTGSAPYTRSVASLAAYAGQSILIRFRAASDVSVGATGWRVDDVFIGNEVLTVNHLTVAATGFPTQSQDVATRIVAPAGRCLGRRR